MASLFFAALIDFRIRQQFGKCEPSWSEHREVRISRRSLFIHRLRSEAVGDKHVATSFQLLGD